MRIVFAGTPDFAVPALSMLLNTSHDLVGVYTQPDRPAGRGRKPKPSPIKLLAEQAGKDVYQPVDFKSVDAREQLAALQPDLMVVVAYGLILPQAVIDLSPLGCINIHGSLLPRWRGAAPIQRAILAGDSKTGVTIMHIIPKLDAGPMLGKAECVIESQDTAADIHDRLAQLGADKLQQLLPDIENRRLQPEVQDESQVTYAAKLSKSEALLDWSLSAEVLQRQICAFNSWPVAHTVLDGKPLRIWRAEVLKGQSTILEPGTVLPAEKAVLDIATGEGILRLLEVQLTGARRMDAAVFLNGNPIYGQRLG